MRPIKLTFILEFRSDRIRPSADASGTVRNERKKLLAWHGVSTVRWYNRYNIFDYQSHINHRTHQSTYPAYETRIPTRKSSKTLSCTNEPADSCAMDLWNTKLATYYCNTHLATSPQDPQNPSDCTDQNRIPGHRVSYISHRFFDIVWESFSHRFPWHVHWSVLRSDDANCTGGREHTDIDCVVFDVDLVNDRWDLAFSCWPWFRDRRVSCVDN